MAETYWKVQMPPVLFEVHAEPHNPHDSPYFACGEVSILVGLNVLYQGAYGMGERGTGVLHDIRNSPRCFTHSIFAKIHIFTPASIFSWPRLILD
jgi:hypothetical protein